MFEAQGGKHSDHPIKDAVGRQDAVSGNLFKRQEKYLDCEIGASAVLEHEAETFMVVYAIQRAVVSFYLSIQGQTLP